MSTLAAITFRLNQDRQAVTSVEYALIVGLIAIAISGVFTTLGSQFSGIFQKIASSITSS